MPRSDYIFRPLLDWRRSDYYEVRMPAPDNRSLVVIGRVWRAATGRDWRYSGNLYGERGRFKTREKAAEQLAVEWEGENG